MQSKVEPERARRLHERLSAMPPLPNATAHGLVLWRYLGGPWELLEEVVFEER